MATDLKTLTWEQGAQPHTQPPGSGMQGHRRASGDGLPRIQTPRLKIVTNAS